MSKIRVMNELLANKIAAGEVVERCASIVKELVENSIDAEAHNIKINLVDGGLKEITITDDGIGMEKDDAILAFERHATSKIYRDDDLFFINTLGFRGEALPSIASVSEVDIKTCASEVGTHIHLKGGRKTLIENSDARKGTIISVTKLFYNTPARLKYLKSDTTELSYCTNYIEKLALAYPKIAFVLTNNDKAIIKTSGSGLLHKTIHEIYGMNVSSNVLQIDAFSDDFHISGYICKPSVLKTNRNDMVPFVNGRLIKNNEINKAINDAYYLYKPVDRYPIVVINIEVDPTLTDVNIHPTKQDIKLSKMQDLYDLLYETIKNTLYSASLIPKLDKPTENIIDKPNVNDNEEYAPIMKEMTQVKMDFNDGEIIKNSEIKDMKLDLIGVVHRTYIVASNEDGLYLLDQHAVHERINYEKNMKALKAKKKYTTKLLVPYVVEMKPSDYELFKNRKEEFVNLGFNYEEFGLNTISITEYPSWLSDGYKEEIPETVIELLLDDKKKFDADKFVESAVKMMSCKMSIRANEEVSLEVLEYLLEELFKCDNPYTCCHGRPTIMKFSNYDLEKMFKRVG